MSERMLICGNEAIGEAAIRAGCDAYFGYPITPQNELTAYMARHMPEHDRVFIQSESEIAAINMVFGAAAVGKRAMTSSSSPGISLKQEGISYLAGCRLPAVIVNMMRGGPGLGNIGPSQADYFQATRGGGHGDYRTPVLAGVSAQEMADLTRLAFDLADLYRTPVMVLGDGVLGQMIEPVTFNSDPSRQLPPKDWALTGAKGREGKIIKSLMLGEGNLRAHNELLQENYRKIEAREVRYEDDSCSGAQLVLVAYGISARICREVVRRMKQEGLSVGLFRPITLWPFPHSQLRDLAGSGCRFLVVEMSYGQMLDDVRLAVNGRAPVDFFGYGGGETFRVEEVYAAAQRALEGSKNGQ